MNLSIALQHLSAKISIATSPRKFLFVAATLTTTVLIILIVAFQINRQLYEQQQINVGRLNQASVRHTTQLQREHLRLYAMIKGNTGEAVDEQKFQLQQDLLESRLKVLKTTLFAMETTEEADILYQEYVDTWQRLKPQIAEWQRDPQNILLKTQIIETMETVEVKVNNIATLVQMEFEDRMSSWEHKSRFLNGLLTIGSLSFVFIIVMIAYASYLFFRNQEMHQQILRNNEQRLSAILDAIPDAVYRINRDGIYTDYKPPINQTHYSPKDAFKGKSIRDALPVDAANLLQTGIDTVLKNGEQLLLELVLPDNVSNEPRLFESRLLPIGKDEVQIIARDITTVKQEEEALLQAQKLESLGVLAGGIAHDFNNLLTGMLGQASLAAAKLARNLPALEHIDKVVLSAERAADLTRQLLAYTGKGKFQIGPLNLNQLIHDTIGLVETSLPNQAKLALQLQDALPLVQSDRAQIQQVIMNLFINAIEALPDGEGSIAISTETREIDADSFASLPTVGNEVRSGIPQSGRYVVIRIEDSGIGMEQATLSRIFDPFFSTKPKGHGLGLSATIGIIRTHQGVMMVQSQPNIGTTFTILLPALAETTVSKAADPPTASKPVADASTTVLVVDDESHVREVATDILAEEGYKVLTSIGGAEAIDLFRYKSQYIGMVLLDLKMPGIGGKETFQELRKIQPDLKVIFTSGYSESEVSMLINESDRVAFLPKPYVADSLTREIAKMLSL